MIGMIAGLASKVIGQYQARRLLASITAQTPLAPRDPAVPRCPRQDRPARRRRPHRPRYCPHDETPPSRCFFARGSLAALAPLEDVQRHAGHADPRTTRLYDRRHKRVTRNIVEHVSI